MKSIFLENILNIRIVSFFFMTILFTIYMFIYLLSLGEKLHNFYLLGIALIFGLINLCLELKYIKIKKSFWFLSIFFIYLVFNTVLTNKDYILIVIYSIIFFIIGSLITINLFYIKDINYNVNHKISSFFFLLFSFFILIFLILAYIQILPNLHPSSYLIECGNAYQVGGYFLTIICLIYSYLFIFSIQEKTNRIKLFIILFTYILIIVANIFLSQIIGSNIGFVNIIGILLTSCVVYFLINLNISFDRLSIINIILDINFIKKILFSIVIAIFFVFTMLIVIIKLLSLDINKFRIFDFPAVETKENILIDPMQEFINKTPISLGSRINLLDNFIIQFKENPIFGNMNIDELTTGTGTYAHSFFLSLLSHLGLFGFILFCIYLYYSFREFFSLNINNLYFKNLWIIYTLIIFSGLFLISLIGTFFIYIVIWFMFGIIFPPIELKK